MADVVAFRRDADDGLVLREENGGVVRLTLNNGPVNALSSSMLSALSAELNAMADDVRVVILSARGSHFSAGFDLAEINAYRFHVDGGRAAYTVLAQASTALVQKLAALRQPVIAEIDGLATAAGCQLVAACDLAICTDSSTFCLPGVNIGALDATAIVAVSRAAHRKQAMEMVLTGETIDASTAKDFGLVNRIVPRQYLSQVVDKYAAVIASKSPEALNAAKRVFQDQAVLPLDEAYAVSGAALVEALMSQDAGKGAAAYLENRLPVWEP